MEKRRRKLVQNKENVHSRDQVYQKDKALQLAFFLYLLLLIRVIIFKYPIEDLMEISRNWEKGVILEGLHQANFQFFKTIEMYIKYHYKLNSFENLVGNVVAFIPLGFLLPFVHKPSVKFWNTFFQSLILILGIEIFQLFSAFGIFDVDDILLNMVGVVMGYCMVYSWKMIR